MGSMISSLRTCGSGLRQQIHPNVVVLPKGARCLCLAVDVTERKRAEEEKERLIVELQESLAKIKTLNGLLPICAWCKKIRTDTGYWQKLESYVKEHSEAEFSHGICPDCMKEHYSEFHK